MSFSWVSLTRPSKSSQQVCWEQDHKTLWTKKSLLTPVRRDAAASNRAAEWLRAYAAWKIACTGRSAH